MCKKNRSIVLNKKKRRRVSRIQKTTTMKKEGLNKKSKKTLKSIEE
jgi:hypothetical protein